MIGKLKVAAAMSLAVLLLMPGTAQSEYANSQVAKAQSLSGKALSNEELDQALRDAMARHSVPGAQLVIVSEGKVAYSTSQGLANARTNDKVHQDTVFEVASLSKPLFGMFVMTFVEKGQLDLDKPLHDYLPFTELIHDPRARAITARMVLTHSTGLPNWRGESDKGLYLAFEPGKGFGYSGEGYEYLARVLAKIGRTDFRGLDRLFVKRITQPLGLKNVRFFSPKSQLKFLAAPHVSGKPVDPEAHGDNFGAAYAVQSSASDFARWATALIKADRALKPASYAAYFTPQSVQIPSDDPQKALGLSDWALGFSIFETPLGRLYVHGGNNYGFTSMIAISRDRRWAAILFTNSDQATPFIIEMFGRLAQ